MTTLTNPRAVLSAVRVGLDNKQLTDLTLVARFKPMSGKTDQAGGLIFRVQDKDNYYILRANALENNAIFFTYVSASRSQLKAGDARVISGTWHELRTEIRGNTFRGLVDSKQVVDSTDDRYKSGGIGLWTKTDSVTCFDDVVLCPVVTYACLGILAGFRSTIHGAHWARVRAVLTLVSFVVNVATI